MSFVECARPATTSGGCCLQRSIRKLEPARGGLDGSRNGELFGRRVGADAYAASRIDDELIRSRGFEEPRARIGPDERPLVSVGVKGGGGIPYDCPMTYRKAEVATGPVDLTSRDGGRFSVCNIALATTDGGVG